MPTCLLVLIYSWELEGDCGGVSFRVSPEKSPVRACMRGGLVIYTGPIAVSLLEV